LDYDLVMNRDRWTRKAAVFVAVLAIIVATGVATGGLNSGMLAAIAIGAGVAAAIFSDGKHTCSPSFFRRRD
jgi:hypothetical protein